MTNKLSKSQRVALAAIAKAGVASTGGKGTRRQVVGSLCVRGLVAYVPGAPMGLWYYRITAAGRAALAQGAS
jgi:hypothetical protein